MGVLMAKTTTGEFSAPLTELHDAWWNSIARAMGVKFPFAFQLVSADSFAMSSRELVIDLVNKLPENASLAEIVREIELLADRKSTRLNSSHG